MPSIREWPVSARPRERLLERGTLACSDADLVALLVGSGRRGRSAIDVAQQLIVALGGLRGLSRCDARELVASSGPATAAKILAGIELGRRVVAASETGAICASAAAAARALAPHFARSEREELKVALLTRKQRLVAVVDVYSGTLTGTSVRLSELFREAVRRDAPAILLAHNHPSGDPTPSGDDLRTTADAIAAGRLLGIEVVDHLVFGAGRWASLRERMPGFKEVAT